jgi:uncharacterized protein (UPF0332 family)
VREMGENVKGTGPTPLPFLGGRRHRQARNLPELSHRPYGHRSLGQRRRQSLIHCRTLQRMRPFSAHFPIEQSHRNRCIPAALPGRSRGFRSQFRQWRARNPERTVQLIRRQPASLALTGTALPCTLLKINKPTRARLWQKLERGKSNQFVGGPDRIKSKHTWDTGRFLLESRRYDGAANRFYYAVFQAVYARWLAQGKIERKQKDVHAFILDQLTPDEDQELFEKLYRLRIRADYHPNPVLVTDLESRFVENAKGLMERFLEED